MSRAVKIWLVTAASLVVIGMIMFAVVMTFYHWDFTKLNTVKYETNTYTVDEEFSSIIINGKTEDISISVSKDKECKVICLEQEKMKHSVEVKDGKLIIGIVDERSWYEFFGIDMSSPVINIYIPESEYESLVIDSSTGDIELINNIKFDSVDISLHTGDIRLNNIEMDTLQLSSTTGDINIDNVTCTGDMKVSTTTGTVKVQNAACKDLFSTASTGDISLNDFIASGKIFIESSTGDVKFDKSDATWISVKTSTGDVTGTLLSEKVFVTETSVGTIDVPDSTSGGKCEIKTSTGDIVIQYKK